MTSRFELLRSAWRTSVTPDSVVPVEIEPVVTNGMQALYGAKAALTGNVGAQDRAQEVLTPECLLAPVRMALGGLIYIDPCAAADETKQFAVVNMFLTEEAYALEAQLAALKGRDKATKKLRAELNKQLKAVYLNGPGLRLSWDRPTFVNHPYKYTHEWMEKLWKEVLKHKQPTVMLCPVRPWRKWWVEYARRADECVWLSPVQFVGHKQPAPMPMCMLTYGCILPHLGKYETGRSKI